MQSRDDKKKEAVEVWNDGWMVESYDDILRNMGIEIVDGVMVATTALPSSLATRAPQTSLSVALKPKGGEKSRGKGRNGGKTNIDTKDESLAVNYGSSQSTGFVPNSNLPVPHPAPSVSPELQNSYIFNKYFRKEIAQQQQESIPRPGTAEYVNYRLRNYLEWLRVQKIKSKKMTFY